MSKPLKIEEVGVITALGNTVGDKGGEVEGYTYSPTFDSSAAGVSGSSVADAIRGKDGDVTNARDDIAKNMKQFKELCDQAAAGYDKTDNDSAQRCTAPGEALNHGRIPL